MGVKTKVFSVTSRTVPSKKKKSKISRMKLTEDERKRLREAVEKADSYEEILRLENILQEGRLPAGVLEEGGDDPENTTQDAMDVTEDD